MHTQKSRLSTLPLLLVALGAAALPCAAQSAAEDLRVSMGKSIVIDYPTDIARISTSNPEIVDAVAVSTREVLLHAKALGSSTVVVWAKTGQRTFYNVSVDHNLEPIRKILKETFPDENIQIVAAKDSVTLSGHVGSQAVADRTMALVASLAKTVVNNLEVSPNPVDKQILLRVKFAQLDRNKSSQFGFNLFSTGALNTPGGISTGQFGPPRLDNVQGTIPGDLAGTTTSFNLSDTLNIFAFRPDLNLFSTLKALQSRGVLQILAEPNLITTNGKEASFLVGGEFPVPILQGGANSGAVTVQFKEFGIRLTFNPVMTGNKTLKMFVKPEVSSIDIANAITFNGFRIPALATRRMETNIELAPGQSFVVGGLIDDRAEESLSKIPGLSAIPVLGALFKSKQDSRSKTELIVLVTPEIVDPLNPGDPKPMPVMPLEFLGPAVTPSTGGMPKSSKKKGAPGSGSNAAQTASAHPAGSPSAGSSSLQLTGDASTVRPVLINLDPDTNAAPAAAPADASQATPPAATAPAGEAQPETTADATTRPATPGNRD